MWHLCVWCLCKLDFFFYTFYFVQVTLYQCQRFDGVFGHAINIKISTIAFYEKCRVFSKCRLVVLSYLFSDAKNAKNSDWGEAVDARRAQTHAVGSGVSVRQVASSASFNRKTARLAFSWLQNLSSLPLECNPTLKKVNRLQTSHSETDQSHPWIGSSSMHSKTTGSHNANERT